MTKGKRSRFNLKLFKRFWAIAKLYWFGEEKRGAIALLALLGCLLLAYTFLRVSLNQQQGVLISSLADKDADRFWAAVRIFLGVLIVYVPLFAGYSYFREKLGVYWRRWLTDNFLGNYFQGRAFYNIGNSNTELDNPDQRISEDIRSFTQESLRFLLVIIVSIFQIVAFSGVLWGISKPLVMCLIIYALFGNVVTTGIFGRILVKLNFEQLKREANFRFALVRIRENAESIAFYRGEEREYNQVKQQFDKAYDNFNLLILWQELYLGLFANGYEFIIYIIPQVVLAPRIFNGELEVGIVTEAGGAFFTIFRSLNIIVDRFQSLANFAAGINRLYDFHEYLEAEREQVPGVSGEREKIDTVENGRLAWLVANFTDS